MSRQHLDKVFHLLPVDFDVRDVVFEDCGHVHFRELVLAEDDEKTSFAARAVADDDQFLPDGRHDGGVSLNNFSHYRDLALSSGILISDSRGTETKKRRKVETFLDAYDYFQGGY